jgi:hypothetical protein
MLLKEKIGANKNFDEPAFAFERRSYNKKSPLFDNLLSSTEVFLSNITINFMPGTVNNILKMLRAVRKQTKPVDDQFLAAEEYDNRGMTKVEVRDSSST